MSDALAGAGVVVAAGSAAASLLLPPGRIRAAAMLAALVLLPALILGDQWDSRQIADLRDDPARSTALAAAALAAIVILAAAFRRWPVALPAAIVAALPFRVPLEAGGDTANLLVPLYLVIAAGTLTTAIRDYRHSAATVPLFRSRGPTASASASPPPTPAAGVEEDGGGEDSVARSALLSSSTTPTEGAVGVGDRAARWLPRVLAIVVVLYALQTLYSPDFSRSLQSVCFFFVPFSLVYALLRDVEWSRRLLRIVLWVVAVEAVAFVAVGSVEYATRSLFWNDQVIRSNEFHTYFRVNSVFWDPNIYGRYLALAIVVAMAALLWETGRRHLALLAALVAVLWVGLVPTFSQSSFAALLAGLAVLAALRWSVRWTAAVVGVAAVAAALFVATAGDSLEIDFSRVNIDTGGRANLVSGGAELFAQRPVWGYGAGSFPRAYREHVATGKTPVSISHTQPITVAAEQGLLGTTAYLALLVTALCTLATGLRASLRAARPGAVNASPTPGPAGQAVGRTPGPAAQAIGRAAVLAAFAALLVHTMAYAGFFEDPIAWVLLAAGASLAAPAVRGAA